MLESTDSLTTTPGNRKLRAAARGSREGWSNPEIGGFSSNCTEMGAGPSAGAGSVLVWASLLEGAGPLLSCAQPIPSARNKTTKMECRFFINGSLRDNDGISGFQQDVLPHCVAFDQLPIVHRNLLLLAILRA